MTLEEIKELRLGDPKTGKTKNPVETYPTPMLVFEADKMGLSSCVLRKPVKITLDDLTKRCQVKEEGRIKPADVEYIDFSMIGSGKMTLDQFGSPAAKEWQETIKAFNMLWDFNPYKTVVIDPLGRFSDFVLDMVCALNNVKVPQIQHWGLAINKVLEFISNFTALPCATVVVGHTMPEKDELTGEMRIVPAIYGKRLPSEIGRFFSQIFYSVTEPGNNGQVEYKIWTKPKGLVKGIGARVPQNLTLVCGPTFKDIYGKDIVL